MDNTGAANLTDNSAAVEAMDFKIVNSDAALVDMVDACLKQPAIALDSEFIRTDTFFPKPALLQIYDREQVYLIDPLAIDDFTPLKMLFLAPDTIKVMHSCSEDMEVFDRLLSCYPQPLIDTQIAASLVGLDFSISYQRLVDAALGKQIDKGETRSNWLQRPLTDKQLSYAADDVLWLLDVYDFLMAKLDDLDRLSWLQEECEELLLIAKQPVSFENYYLKIKTAWRLDPQSLNVLRSLCAWREREARAEDVPRSRVVTDAALQELSRERPRDKNALAQISDLRHSMIRNYGSAILAEIEQADSQGKESYPPVLQQKNSSNIRNAIKKMKQVVSSLASSLDIPDSLLARKRDLEAYLFADDRQLELLGRGWRKDILLEQLDPIVDNYHANSDQ